MAKSRSTNLLIPRIGVIMAKGADAQTSLRLPHELYERLAQAANNRGQGIGEEMRRRLMGSFEADIPSANDLKTRRLLAAIAAVADSISPSLGPWHKNAPAFTALKA